MKHLDILAHIFLILGLGVGVVAVYRLRFDSTDQFLVILVITFFYLLWGTTYHHIKGEIEKKLFVEYLLIALIVVICAFLVFVI
ncbi:hypothetical protein A3D07_02310 [Candidatus Curtissbacteria bacterium RIFCSPHIGHO2_02_FULL_42_15]|uniref:Uncharacterized protein n=1 Tax=Candidatus Curtissbacteria bacterium RIFCSPHIGHO2_02_FULL_42_15 TaxID=1797716 RepID=A0A1F5GH18_9BACT|nr:MAG: hypothetical protein A3D07_02310 [Candidatus Curtissbacteria bacterium RIFCSPHIGHO2_02_FULL_42_15]